MFLGQIGLAIAFDSLWLLAMLVPFALVIRYGVVAREEVYLGHKFSDAYRGYCPASGAGYSTGHAANRIVIRRAVQEAARREAPLLAVATGQARRSSRR